MTGIDGIPCPVSGLDLRSRARHGVKDAALAAVAAAILLLVAF